MNSRRMEFFIGMMVIGIVLGVFVMTLLFRSESGIFVGGNNGRRMNIEFKNGAGISQNSLVLKSGIRIGRVYSVILLDDMENSRVRVAFELEPEANIYSNEIAKINRTFLGDASIEIVDNPDYDVEKDGPIVALGPGAELKSMRSADLMNAVTSIEGDLGAALQNINEASSGITLFMKNLNTFLGDEQELQFKKERLQGVFTELQDTLVSIRSLASHMDEVVSDKELKSNIKTATSKIPQIMNRVEDISAKANVFMDNATAMSDDLRGTLARAGTTFDLVDKNLDNINVFTTSLADNGPEMMISLNEGSAEIKGAIDEVKGAIENIASFVENVNDKIDDPNSPIGMLTDERVGKDLRKIVTNVSELTEKAYPIMDDARVFTNKIAHKPSELLWSKTQTKGGTLSDKFGWQTRTPRGGVSSSLYRQTPAGSKICSRNYYEPLADSSYMDAKTRAIYESEVANRETLRGEGFYAPDYSNVVPESGLCANIKAKTNRIRWSLDSFWSRLSPKRRALNEIETADYAQYNGGFVPVNAVGYDAYPGVYVEQPVYSQYQNAYVDGAYMNGVYADDCGPQINCAPNDCYAPTCDAPSCNSPESCGAYGNSSALGARTGGAGYQSGNLGPYQAKEPENLNLNVSENSAAEEIEELPSSINRRVDGNGGGFEDDGLPVQYAPPTGAR